MFLQQLVALQVVHMFQQLVLLGAASQQHVSNIYWSWRSRRRLTTLSLRGTHIHTHFGRRAPRERRMSGDTESGLAICQLLKMFNKGQIDLATFKRLTANDGNSRRAQHFNIVVNS